MAQLFRGQGSKKEGGFKLSSQKKPVIEVIDEAHIFIVIGMFTGVYNSSHIITHSLRVLFCPLS